MTIIDESPAALARDAQVSAALIRHSRGDLQLLESILEHTHMLVAYLDTRFDFVRVNRAYAQADGQTPGFFAGKNHFDLYPNEDNRIIFARVLATGEPYFAHAKAFEYADNPQRGVSYWDWSLVPTKDDDGNVTGLVLTLADVTQVVATRESLRSERDLADGLVRTARAIILVLDTHGNIVRFNPFLEELTGYRLEEVAGRPWIDTFIPQEDRARIGALFAAAISGTRTLGNINALRTRDGERRLVQWFDTALHDAGGNVSGLLAVGIDNTDLISSQHDLELFKSIVRSSSEAIVIADRGSRISFVNAAYEALSGLAAAAVSGRDLLGQFIDSESLPADLRASIGRGDCGGWEGEAMAADRHGRRFPVWLRIDCVGGGDGGDAHYIALAHDITAQKLQEQRRLDEEKRRHETFVREIHHRIKNHLQGVIGLLRNSRIGRHAPADEFDVLIGKISALAGVYELGSRHAGDAVPLIGVVNSVVATIAGLVGVDCRIEAEADTDASAGEAWLGSGESVPIALVINELITNAHKHRSSADVPPAVSVRMAPDRARLRVENAGSLPAGFDFAGRSGIGMGLSLVHSLLGGESAKLSISQAGDVVIADLMLAPPVLVRRAYA